MTQPESTNPTLRRPASRETARNGLFLVKPSTKSHLLPKGEPSIARKSRSLGLLALGGAASAAPLFWLLHKIW